MQMKVFSIMNWNTLVTYLNKLSQEGLHAYERDGENFKFEENKEKRYHYFLEKSYISIFEGNKRDLKNTKTEEVTIIKNKGAFIFSSFPRIYRNEIERTQEIEEQKYTNMNSFELYLLIIMFVLLNLVNIYIQINIAPVFIISVVLTFIISRCVDMVMKYRIQSNQNK